MSTGQEKRASACLHCGFPNQNGDLLDLANEAHKLLEPLADCDPAIRDWLDAHAAVVSK